jgi:preprotein translocase subunit Sec63
MGVKIIKGKDGKTVKVKQGVLLYITQDNTVKGELILNEKVVDLSNFSAIILLSEVGDNGSNSD